MNKQSQNVTGSSYGTLIAMLALFAIVVIQAMIAGTRRDELSACQWDTNYYRTENERLWNRISGE